MSFRRVYIELRRRNVVKAALSYIAVSWLVLQASSIVFPALEFSQASMKNLLMVLVIVFPFWLVFAWIYDITPEGIIKTGEIGDEIFIPKRRRRENAIIIGVMSLAIILLVADRVLDLSGKIINQEKDLSIAVLPFDNLGEEEHTYFSMGISEDILTQLGKIKALRILSRFTLREYDLNGKTPKEIGKELNVRYLLSGNVRTSGEKLRIGCQLIKTEDESETWSETYDRRQDDVFWIQSDVAKNVANSLKARLTEIEKKRTSIIPTENLEAYNLTLKGREQYIRFTNESNERAIEYFRKALKEDPGIALAWAGMSDALIQSIRYYGTRPKSNLDSALYYSRKAVELDQESADTWKALAFALSIDGQLDEAAQAYRKALVINPNHGPSLNNLGTSLMTKDPIEAISLFKRNILIDPLGWHAYANLGHIYLDAGLYSMASDRYRTVLSIDSTRVRMIFHLAQIEIRNENEKELPLFVDRILSIDSISSTALGYAGYLALYYNKHHAMQYLERAMNAEDYSMEYQGNVALGLGYLYFKEGRTREALNILDENLEFTLKRHGQFSNYWTGTNTAISMNHIIRGNYAEAIKWLEKAKWYMNPDLFKYHPVFNEIREKPEFVKLMDKWQTDKKQLKDQILELEKKGT